MTELFITLINWRGQWRVLGKNVAMQIMLSKAEEKRG
jgi:hypothetical protein